MEGSWIPRYVIESDFKWNGKLSLHWVTRSWGRDVLRVKDLEKLIFRLDKGWKHWNSNRSMGNVVKGSVRNSSMLSAKAAYLYSL